MRVLWADSLQWLLWEGQSTGGALHPPWNGLVVLLLGICHSCHTAPSRSHGKQAPVRSGQLIKNENRGPRWEMDTLHKVLKSILSQHKVGFSYQELWKGHCQLPAGSRRVMLLTKPSCPGGGCAACPGIHSSGRAERGPIAKAEFYASGIIHRRLWSRFAGRNQPLSET